MPEVPLDLVAGEKPAGFVHLVECLVNSEPQFGGVFQRHLPGDLAADLMPVLAQFCQGFVSALTPKGQDKNRGDLEIRRGSHLADGDRHAVEIGIVHITPRQHIRQCAADKFAHAQLPLRGARAIVKAVLCHRGGIRVKSRARKQGFAIGARRRYTGRQRIKRSGNMSELPGVAITGVSGRMGRMLTETVLASDKCRLVGAVERSGHSWVGQDLGLVLGGGATGVVVTSDPLEAFAPAQAVIDFTAPAATLEFARLAAQARAVHVIGTTGMSEAEIAALEPAARHAVIVRAGNMSLGVNLLTLLTRRVAAALDADFDIEIVEAHHRYKVDAPSGTALMLGEAAAQGRGVALADVSDRGRDGITGARVRGDIGFAAIRGGDVVGEHDVIFAADGERIVLRHVATDRTVFARGALKAALWGLGRKPGQYDMLDVLGLST